MANILDKLFPMGSAESKTRNHVRDRLGESLSAFGGQNRRFRELNRYYHSLSPQVETRDNDRMIRTGRKDRIEVFVPQMFTIIESAVPTWVLSQFGRKPYVNVRGRTEDDAQREKAITGMIDYDFDRANVISQAVPMGRQMFKFGTGIGKVTYRYDARKTKRRVSQDVPTGFDAFKNLLFDREVKVEDRTVIDFDGPWLDWVSIYNFGVDPLYWRLDDMRYCWERRWTDRARLDWENEQYQELTGKPLYKNLDKIPVMPKGFVEGIYEWDAGDDTSEAMGWAISGFRRQGYTQIREADADLDHAVEIIELWEDGQQIFLANGEVPIREGENPYWDKEKPYVMCKAIELEGYPWGMGFLQPIKTLQEELNHWRNLNMRQAELNIANVWAIDESIGLPEQGIEIDPGDVVQVPFYASGKPALVPLLPPRALPPESQTYEDRIIGDIEKAVASSTLRTGGGGGKGIETATEAKMIGSAEQLRVRLINLMSEHTFLKELARKFLSRRQQFFKKEQVFRVLGKEGYFFQEMTPQDIAGQYDFIPEGSSTHIGKEVLRQQIEQFLALTANPMVAQVTNVYEAVKEFWIQTDHPFPERFIFAPPEKVWDPKDENIVLLAGQFVPVQPNEPHAQHMPVHQQALTEAASVEGMQRLQEHIAEHDKYLGKSSLGPSNPQEQPGLRGYAGNVPNFAQAGPETAGGIAARVNAGPGV